MLRKRGDRRGLNPRQLEPQSSEPTILTNTGDTPEVASGRVKSRGCGGGRTRSRKAPRELEGPIQERILFALNVHGGVVALRNNVGAIKKGARYIRYGLGGSGGVSAKGGADIIAFVAVEDFAVVVAIEVKRPGEDLDDHQVEWCERMRRYGVVVGRAESVEEALALVDEARRRAVAA